MTPLSWCEYDRDSPSSKDLPRRINARIDGRLEAKLQALSVFHV